jgi:hypothetical protein
MRISFPKRFVANHDPSYRAWLLPQQNLPAASCRGFLPLLYIYPRGRSRILSGLLGSCRTSILTWVWLCAAHAP